MGKDFIPYRIVRSMGKDEIFISFVQMIFYFIYLSLFLLSVFIYLSFVDKKILIMEKTKEKNYSYKLYRGMNREMALTAKQKRNYCSERLARLGSLNVSLGTINFQSAEASQQLFSSSTHCSATVSRVSILALSSSPSNSTLGSKISSMQNPVPFFFSLTHVTNLPDSISLLFGFA